MQGGGGGIAEHHAEKKKDRSVSQAGKDHDGEIGLQFSCAGAVEDVVLPGRTEGDIDEREVGEDGAAKQDHGADGPGGEFGQEQNLAAHRREQIEMEAALDHLAANEARENSQASEEDCQAEIVELDDPGQHLGIFGHLRTAGGGRTACE